MVSADKEQEMDFRYQNTDEVAARICNASGTAEAFALYREFAPLLAEYKFIFATEKGGLPGFAVNRTFSAGASVRSVFKKERVLVLDPETFREMLEGGGNSTYPIDYSISLDTQALSYLEPFIAGAYSRLPTDFQEVFEFIARDEVYVDPLPYIMENLDNLSEIRAADRIFSKLKAYEVLRTLDAEWLQRKGEVRSRLTEYELSVCAQQHISRMYMDLSAAAVMKGLRFRHQYMYACLLKMACIQAQLPSAAVENKVQAFLEFCDSRLATMNSRETAVAREYFERGQGLPFFGKIQRGSKNNVLDSLRNMAWDLWHIRQLEEALTFQLTKEARYFFPALLTFDKRFIEIIDLYPLKACAFKADSGYPLPFYDGDWASLRLTDPGREREIIERYFSRAAVASRDGRRDRAKSELFDTVAQLEEEARSIFGSSG